jgi:hypothetical protein
MGTGGSDFSRTRLLHTDSLFHHRVDLLLLGQSILIAAAATVWTEEVLLLVLVAGTGLLLLRFQSHTLHRLHNTFKRQAERVARTDADYATDRAAGTSDGPNSWSVFATWIPRCLSVLWVLMILLRIGVWVCPQVGRIHVESGYRGAHQCPTHSTLP